MLMQKYISKNEAELYINLNKNFLRGEGVQKVSESDLRSKINESKEMRKQLLRLTPFPDKQKMADEMIEVINGYTNMLEKNYRSEITKKIIKGAQRFKSYDNE